MNYRFDIVEVEPVILAVTEAQVRQSDIPSRAPAMFDSVYAWLRESKIDPVGHNYMVYDRFTSQGMRMQVGVPIAKRFSAASSTNTSINCVDLVTGRAAHTTHIGPYSGLPIAHTQLNEWCARESLKLSGMSWEVYGDWQDDQSKLVTDIYFRLK